MSTAEGRTEKEGRTTGLKPPSAHKVKVATTAEGGGGQERGTKKMAPSFSAQSKGSEREERFESRAIKSTGMSRPPRAFTSAHRRTSKSRFFFFILPPRDVYLPLSVCFICHTRLGGRFRSWRGGRRGSRGSAHYHAVRPPPSLPLI